MATPASKRPTPFTPRSTRSTTTAAERDMSSRLARTAAPTPVLTSTHKKYKAPLSIEARTRKGTLPTVPGSPSKSRPTSRAGSRMGTASPALTPMFPQHDVEESVVDFQSVGIDLTGDEHGGDVVVPMPEVAVDKVMVSVRVRPPAGNIPTAWSVTSADNTIHLSGTPTAPAIPSPANRFTFDAIHTTQPTAPLYATAARPHVHAFMSGYNAVVFAYGQTASGKTYTLSGSDEQPGIIPRSIREIFAFIRATPSREYLLRCSYLEIYNETIHDLLAPSLGAGQAKGVEIQGGGAGGEVILSGLREEVVTSLASVREVLRRGEGNRRTASTDWNERSSRSHSVFRVVCESRERSNGEEDRSATPTMNGRHTPGLGGRQTPGAGGPRLQAKGGRSVQTSVLSLIDLAGSEKATSDKERTKEGRYINTSLLTLGTVISTLAENAAKGKSDHVPYRNSKLTRMLQPSLSGNARISVVCTINPDASAVSESMSTLQFARRIKGVQLNAQKKEIVDTDALIERYRKEIEDLKRRLEEREQEAPVRKRRLSAREQIDESKAMGDLNSRIKQLTKLILTSQSVGSGDGDEERPGSPVKIDFDMSPYQLQQELLTAKLQLESQSNQILSLEATLSAQPEVDLSVSSVADDSEKDRVIAEQARVIRELEGVVRGYEANDATVNAQMVKEELEREWQAKLDAERRVVAEKEVWAGELVRQLEKEKQTRLKLEEERRVLAAFVNKFDSTGWGALSVASSPVKVMPSPGGASAAFANRREARQQQQVAMQNTGDTVLSRDSSPLRMSLDLSMTGKLGAHPSLLEQMPEEEWLEESFDADLAGGWGGNQTLSGKNLGTGKTTSASIFGLSSKENVPA